MKESFVIPEEEPPTRSIALSALSPSTHTRNSRRKSSPVPQPLDDHAADILRLIPTVEAQTIKPANRPARIVHLRPRRTENPRSREFRRQFFRTTTDKEWSDWRWQSRHRFKNLADIERVLNLSDAERGALGQGGMVLPVGITPYYMSLLDANDATHALRRTVIPSINEFLRSPGEADDPLGEDGHSPVPGLVHRYPDRVLMLPIDFCSTYCRYCTR